MGSLKSQCTTFHRSSIDTIALNCLVFEKNAFFYFLATDWQTDEQMDSTDALSRSRCRERRLNQQLVRSEWPTRSTGDRQTNERWTALRGGSLISQFKTHLLQITGDGAHYKSLIVAKMTAIDSQDVWLFSVRSEVEPLQWRTNRKYGSGCCHF